MRKPLMRHLAAKRFPREPFMPWPSWLWVTPRNFVEDGWIAGQCVLAMLAKGRSRSVQHARQMFGAGVIFSRIARVS